MIRNHPTPSSSDSLVLYHVNQRVGSVTNCRTKSSWFESQRRHKCPFTKIVICNALSSPQHLKTAELKPGCITYNIKLSLPLSEVRLRRQKKKLCTPFKMIYKFIKWQKHKSSNDYVVPPNEKCSTREN